MAGCFWIGIPITAACEVGIQGVLFQSCEQIINLDYFRV